jgi:hypothetical protein
VPLFSNYVFALVDDDQRRTCLATSTISRCLPVFDQGWSVARVNNALLAL